VQRNHHIPLRISRTGSGGTHVHSLDGEGICSPGPSWGVFFFFFVGKGGNASCTIAPGRGCGGLQQGSPSWHKAFGRECPVSYPLKPPFAGVPAASRYVKLICGPANGPNLVNCSSAHPRRVHCLVAFLSSSMKRVAFPVHLGSGGSINRNPSRNEGINEYCTIVLFVRDCMRADSSGRFIPG